MITGIIGLSNRAEFETLEQQSHIIWHLRKGSTITPIVLKLLTDIICNYHWQLSPDWTTKSDCYEERGNSTNYIQFHQTSQQNMINRQPVNSDMYPHDHIRKAFSGSRWRFVFVAEILTIYGATEGWTIWALSGVQRIQHVFEVWRFIWCVVSLCGNWHYFVVRQSQLGEASMVYGCQTVPIGFDKYMIRLMSLFICMVAAVVDTLWAGDWYQLPWYPFSNPSSNCKAFNFWLCNLRVSGRGGCGLGRLSGMLWKCTWIVASAEVCSERGSGIADISVLWGIAFDDLLASEEVVRTFFIRVEARIELLGVTLEGIPSGKIGTRCWTGE
jgi:hypothetical protein